MDILSLLCGFGELLTVTDFAMFLMFYVGSVLPVPENISSTGSLLQSDTGWSEILHFGARILPILNPFL